MLNDAEILEGKTLPVSDGVELAALLEFTLPSSCYATMLFRELTRGSSLSWATAEADADQGNTEDNV